MDRLPPGVRETSKFYIKVSGVRWNRAEPHWASRFANSRHWNISMGFAEPFNSLSDAKKVVRALSKRQDMVGASFTVVELRTNYTVREIWPLDALDRLAQI